MATQTVDPGTSDIIPEYSPEHLIALSEPKSSQFGFIKVYKT